MESAPREFRGDVESCDRAGVSGWAMDPNVPARKIEVCIVLDYNVVATLKCDLPRGDLKSAGVGGDGNFGFHHSFAEPLSESAAHRLTVVFRETGKTLPRGRVRLAGLAPPSEPLPLLVTGTGRSGTTLLMSRLAASPQVCIEPTYPYETLMIAYYSNVLRALTAHAERDKTNGAGIFFSQPTVGPNPYFDGRWYWSKIRDVEKFIEFFVGEVPGDLQSLLRKFIFDYYRTLAAELGKPSAKFFCEKNVALHQVSRDFAKELSDATHEIVLYRDPRDLYVSQLAFFKTDPAQLMKNIEWNCRTLVQIKQERANLQAFVSYEGLVREPAEVMAGLATFLGVEGLSPDLDAEDRQFRRHGTSESATASIGRWRTELSPEIATEIERRCRPYFDEFDGCDIVVSSPVVSSPPLAGASASPPSGGGQISTVRGAPRRVGIEFRKSYEMRSRDGFIKRFLSGRHILDIGYRGGDAGTVPITEHAIGVDLDYPGYDGVRLPFPDESQDAVLASHVLEHITSYREVLLDWHRVLRVGGYLLIFVPHRYLYERRPDLPSRWNGDHKRFYTATSLLAELDEALPLNGWRIRHLVENDRNFDYDAPAKDWPRGCYEIELVVEKIKQPAYNDALVLAPDVRRLRDAFDQLVLDAVMDKLTKRGAGATIPTTQYFPAWHKLREKVLSRMAGEVAPGALNEEELKRAVRELLESVEVDREEYGRAYPELLKAQAEGKIKDLASHWRYHGYFEGRSWD